MPAKHCRVTITDADGIEHTVEVTASTLFEAVALAIRNIRRADWVGEIPQGLHPVRVVVRDIPVEHKVTMQMFCRWLAQDGRSPADKMTRERVRQILRE